MPNPIYFLRTFILFWIAVFDTLIFSLGGIFGSVFSRSIGLSYWVQINWARAINRLFNVHVHATGRENAPPQGAVIYLFTHKSHFDIPAIMTVLPPGFNFGAKAELFKIPFFGSAMNRLGVLKIHRADREKVLQLYADSISRLKKGESFVLAPEGTRQTTKELGPFKAGPFIFAISAQVPVVPVLVFGSEVVLPAHGAIINNGKWRGDITIRVLPPIPTAGITLDERTEFQNKVREIMVKAYSEGPVPAPHRAQQINTLS